jgi:microcystin-dependent protein
MSDPFFGTIRLVGFNFAPVGWALCAGRQIVSEKVRKGAWAVVAVEGNDGRQWVDSGGSVAVPRTAGIGRVSPLAERLGEGRVTQAIAAGRRARRGPRSSCSARSTRYSRGRAVAFCAIGRTRTRLTAGSAVKAERSDGFDAIGVNTVEGGVRDLRWPARAVFEARARPRAWQPATLDQWQFPLLRANQFLGADVSVLPRAVPTIR